MRKISIVVFLLALFVVLPLAAQDRLSVSSEAPRIDGIVAEGEYSLEIEMRRAVLYLNRTEQTLSVAVHSQLDGWVAVGLGSTRMDQASIYIGYVDSGRVVFAAELGRGHDHENASVAGPEEYRLTEDGEGTILELSFPVEAFVLPGARTLSLIAACGRKDNLDSYHVARKGLEIGL